VPHTKPLLSIVTGFLMFAMPVAAQEVWITPDTPFVEIDVNDRFFVIERNADNEAVISAAFAKTSRPCPPFCVSPMQIADGVETVGELELLAYLENEVQSGAGLLVDVRAPEIYAASTIPGSINLPVNLLTVGDNNPFLIPILMQLGGVQLDGGSWDFTAAKDLALYCDGAWCEQASLAIRNLLTAGYPAEKLYYYRGGMQDWLMLGLTVIAPE